MGTLEANVGIGTTSPNANLHVNSATTNLTNLLRLTPSGGTFTNSNGILIDVNGVGDTSANFIHGRVSAQTNSTFYVKTNGGAHFAGSVGVGLTNPTYQLQLSTDSAAKPGTSTWTIASDERLKDIRAPFTRGLDSIIGLNTVYFNYKKDNPLDLPSEKEYVGIKAQDAQKAIPEAVSIDEQSYICQSMIVRSLLFRLRTLN